MPTQQHSRLFVALNFVGDKGKHIDRDVDADSDTQSVGVRFELYVC